VDHRTEPPGGGDRLQPGNARAEDEHLRRLDRAGRGRQHRQEAGQAVCGDERCLVPADGRLRREGVHRLRTRDPRDRLHRERRHALRGQAFDPLAVGQRLEEADEDCAVP
jgi:hypothetical protein